MKKIRSLVSEYENKIKMAGHPAIKAYKYITKKKDLLFRKGAKTELEAIAEEPGGQTTSHKNDSG